MILFRMVEKPLPPGWEAGRHWQAELWSDEHEDGCPLGIAWLYVSDVFQAIEYILVRDDCRRRGHATAIVRACRERWPGVELTGAISEAGEALIKSLGEGKGAKA